ncbi:MAG: DUF6288 domain-containing protein, partial [Akkermansiaceae bacterium]
MMGNFLKLGGYLLLLLTKAGVGKEVGGNKAYPVFPLGPTGIHASIEPGFKVTVKSVEPDSPADESGLQAGDIITKAGGTAIDGPDPRVILGQAIGLAEAYDGVLKLGVLREGAGNPSGSEISIQVQPLGAYRDTWPNSCPKSQAIILKNAQHVSGAIQKDGSYQLGGVRLGFNDLKACMASLFLLSTGDGSYLPLVANHARALSKSAETRKNAGGHINWQLGYQGIFLG